MAESRADDRHWWDVRLRRHHLMEPEDFADREVVLDLLRSLPDPWPSVEEAPAATDEALALVFGRSCRSLEGYFRGLWGGEYKAKMDRFLTALEAMQVHDQDHPRPAAGEPGPAPRPAGPR